MSLDFQNQQANLVKSFDLLYRRLLYTHTNKEIFINKNNTPFTFWFSVDAMYFSDNINYQLDRLKSFRENYKFEHHHMMLDEDEQFVLDAYKTISEGKNTLHIGEIKQTSLIECIELYDRKLKLYQMSNAEKVEQIQRKLAQQIKQKKQFYQSRDINYIKTLDMFKLLPLEESIIQKQLKLQQINSQKPKCFICNSWSGKLFKCSNTDCELIVHSYCYPDPIKNANEANSEQHRQYPIDSQHFTCLTCRQTSEKLPSSCILCPCADGFFIKTSENNEVISYQILCGQTQTSFKIFQEEKKKMRDYKQIHLTCCIWNQLIFNVQTKLVMDLEQIPIKRFQNCCEICSIGFGSTVPCSIQNCRRNFHPQCAKRKNLQMVYIKATSTKTIIQIFCQRHRKEKIYQKYQSSHLKIFKQIRKYFEGADRQIKRLESLSPYNDKKMLYQYQICTLCSGYEGQEPISICKHCQKWYHLKCGNSCIYCS